MDVDIAAWILEFLLRQDSVDDGLLKDLISVLPLPNNNPSLKKSLILRKLELDIEKGTISECTLDYLEQIEEFDHAEGNTEVSEAMKAAYCAVAVHCTAKFLEESVDDNGLKYFSSVKRIWSDRITEMEKFEVAKRVGLVSDDLLGWMDDFEDHIRDVNQCEDVFANYKKLDVLEAVRGYVTEAKEMMGPSFLELVVETLNDDALREIGLAKDEDPDGQIKNSTVHGTPNSKDDDDRSSLRDGNADALHANGDDLEDKNKGRKISIMEQNNPADAVQLRDSLDSSDKTRSYLPLPQKRPILPPKDRNNNKRSQTRKKKRWTLVEEDTLRTGVLQYVLQFGKGNWKPILNMYRDVFIDRTEVDLKDKWRNLIR